MRGLTQEQLAKKLETDMGYIARLETGRIKNPGIDMMGKIAEALNSSIGELTGESDHRPTKTEVTVWTDDELSDDEKRTIETIVKSFKQKRR